MQKEIFVCKIYTHDDSALLGVHVQGLELNLIWHYIFGPIVQMSYVEY